MGKKNWTNDETVVLVDRVVPNIDLVNGAFGSTYTESDRTNFWRETTLAINAVSLVERSEKNIRKKWVDLKSLTKKKEQQIRKSRKQTGGGPPQPPLSLWEEKVISVLPNPVIEGFLGGTDTFQDNLNLSEPDEQVSLHEVGIADSDGKKSTSTSLDLLSRNDMEIAFHNAIVNSINDTVNEKQDTSHSSKTVTTLPQQLSGKGDTSHSSRTVTTLPQQLSGKGDTSHSSKTVTTLPQQLSGKGVTSHSSRTVTTLPQQLSGKGDTSHSSKTVTTLPQQLSGKGKRPNKRPFGGRLRNDASCDCSERLNAIEADLLEESKKRNVLLTELCGKLDVIIELKKQKLSILAEQNRLQREESVIGSLWEKSY